MSILHHGFGVASALASSRKEEADGDPDEPPHRMSTKLDKITVSGMFDIMKPDEHPTVEASFEEKSIWIQLAAMLLVFGGYLIVAGTMLTRDAGAIGPFIPLLIAATVLIIVVNVAGHAVAAVMTSPEDCDERDRLISWRSEARSAWMLGAGVIIAIGCLALSMTPAWIANILLLSMFLSQVICYTLQLVSYRRGF